MESHRKQRIFGNKKSKGNVCHARVENIYEKGDFGAVPDLENSYTEEYEYEIYY